MPKVTRKRRTTTTNRLSRPKKASTKATTTNVSQITFLCSSRVNDFNNLENIILYTIISFSILRHAFMHI